ncbi:hypothetical protein SSX86_013277 [Deinandra increscens subsp. villosa]|uniref:Uncharacterized protein n=1 Tax=Deinandra increscens subsp. villosa TaxID=3103831 RepID=A0AAP0D5T6_9ASTR
MELSLSVLETRDSQHRAFEDLLDVIDAIDARFPEEAKDEFTRILVQQGLNMYIPHFHPLVDDEKTRSQASKLAVRLNKALHRHYDQEEAAEMIKKRLKIKSRSQDFYKRNMLSSY